MDMQVSYVRLLIGDNNLASPTYTDAEIRSVCTLGTPGALPPAVQVAGILGFSRFPAGGQ